MKKVNKMFVSAALLIGSACGAAMSESAAQAEDKGDQPPRTSFCLWQLPNQTHTQMMSYIIQTPNGKVIAIDGGMPGDAAYLAEFIEGLGNRVEAWFITHPHDDHFNALRDLLGQDTGMEIKTIYGSMPTDEWMARAGSEGEQESFRLFKEALDKAGRTVTELTLGQELVFDGARFEVLGIKNPELTQNAINNNSIVLRVSDPAKSVLFLGDLGVEGGEKLLKGPYADRLKADYVQMAHHGQNGVGEAVYQQISPTCCLWPTPKWLWDNDKGGGPNSGPWRTLEVRAWMDKLDIKRHFVMYEGLHTIE